jgi:hypothetical protein
MAKERVSLGQAIDTVIDALEPLDANARKTALNAVCAHLEIEIGSGTTRVDPNAGVQVAPAAPVVQPAQPEVTPAIQKQIDIRSLKNEKKPANAIQMSCVVAYYLQELAPEDEKKSAVTKTDLEKYFKQGGFQLPESLQDTLPNAKKAGYFESASRGAYKLNAVGYNLVAHNLPTDSADN